MLAFAADTGWPAFPVQCHSELEPAWAVQAEKGRQWDQDSALNLAKLQELTGKICPDYFKRPNDTDAIHAFNTSKGFILDHSPAVEKQGDALLAFLKSGYNDYSATFAPLGIDFSASACGQYMRETQQRTANRLNEIRVRISQLASSCFKTNAQQNAEAVKAWKPKVVGQGAPDRNASSTAGQDTNVPSDITGTKKRDDKIEDVLK